MDLHGLTAGFLNQLIVNKTRQDLSSKNLFIL